MSADYVSSLQGEALIRYRRKLKLCDMDDCPYRLPNNCWKNDPKEWPPVDFGNIYVYLVDMPG